MFNIRGKLEEKKKLVTAEEKSNNGLKKIKIIWSINSFYME